MTGRKALHITEADYLEGMEDNLGFCTACGETQSGCEPDAREYKCESCGEAAVFGFEEMNVMGMVVLLSDESVEEEEDDEDTLDLSRPDRFSTDENP